MPVSAESIAAVQLGAAHRAHRFAREPPSPSTPIAIACSRSLDLGGCFSSVRDISCRPSCAVRRASAESESCAARHAVARGKLPLVIQPAGSPRCGARGHTLPCRRRFATTLMAGEAGSPCDRKAYQPARNAEPAFTTGQKIERTMSGIATSSAAARWLLNTPTRSSRPRPIWPPYRQRPSGARTWRIAFGYHVEASRALSTPACPAGELTDFLLKSGPGSRTMPQGSRDAPRSRSQHFANA